MRLSSRFSCSSALTRSRHRPVALPAIDGIAEAIDNSTPHCTSSPYNVSVTMHGHRHTSINAAPREKRSPNPTLPKARYRARSIQGIGTKRLTDNEERPLKSWNLRRIDYS